MFDVQDGELPWVEKYRPKCIDEVVHQDALKRVLKHVVASGNMPHCLFHGPPGTGKTSAAVALCRELFGATLRNRRVLELNASDDRGIAVVREKIKGWARTATSAATTVTFPDGSTRTTPKWKVIILDEADMMTSDAQSALRRVMEDCAAHTRFIIICNYLSRIIDPVASRCAKYRFEPISHEAQIGRLRNIAAAEGVKVEPDALKELLMICEGDLRMGVMLLQSASSLYELEGAALTKVEIQQVAGYPPLERAQQLWRDIIAPLVSLDDCIRLSKAITAEGWDINHLLKQLLLIIASAPTASVSDIGKSKMASVIAECQYHLVHGAKQSLQILHVVSTLHGLTHGKA